MSKTEQRADSSEFTHSNWIIQSYYSSPNAELTSVDMLYSFPSISPLTIHLLLAVGRSVIYQNDHLHEQIPNLALALQYNEAHMNE